MSKITKVIKAVGHTATDTADKVVSKDSNNLLLIILIIVVWLYLFFTKE